MGDWLYEIRGLKKSFIPGRLVLDVKTLSIPRGKMTAIVGASGSGKTTFMNILGGLLKPDLPVDDDQGASSIQLKLPDGRTFNLSDGGANLPRDAVSFVFQEGHLLKSGTIGLNLGVARLLAKRTAKKAKLEEWRDFSRLSEAEPLSRRVGQLSGGQQQRVGLARAFARNPQIIFADEPSSSLDPSLGMEMMRELAAWCAAERERTVLWVTHNYDQAKLADKLLVLKGGGVLDGAIEPIDCPKSADEIKRLVYGEEHAEPIDFPPPPEDPPRTRLQSWFSLFPQILKGFSLAGAELWRPAEKEGFNPFRFFRQYSRWPATIMLASVIALTVLIGSAASIAQTHFERQVNDSRLRHVLIEGNLLKRRCSGITPPHLRQLDRLFKSRLETRVSEPCDERNAPDMELLLDIERDQATEVDAASAMGNRSNERIAFARRHDLVTFDSRMGIDHGLDAYSNRLDNRLLMMETNEPLLFEEPVLPLSEFPRRRTSSHVNMTLHQVLVENPPCYDDRTGDADACNTNREMPGVPSRKSIVVSRDVMLMLICQSSAGRKMMALTPKDNEDEFAFLDRKDATFEDAKSVCLDRSPSSFTQAELSNLWGSEGVPKIYIGLTRGQHQEFDIAGYFPNDMSDGITTFRAVTTFANAEYAVAENDNVGPHSRWRQKVNNPRAAAVYFTPDTYETVFSLLDGQHYTYDRNMVERFGRLLSLSSTLNYLFVFARFGSLVVGFAIICSIVMSYLTENTRSFSVLIAHGRALPILTISLVLQILFASILAVVFVLAIASLGFGALVHYKLFNLDLLGASPADFLVYNLVVPSTVIVAISLIATLLIMVVWRARNRGRLAEALSQS